MIDIRLYSLRGLLLCIVVIEHEMLVTLSDYLTLCLCFFLRMVAENMSCKICLFGLFFLFIEFIMLSLL